MLSSLVILFVFFLLSGQSLSAQTVVQGVITEVNSDTKVVGAMLYLIDAETNKSLSVTQSNNEGRFTFKCTEALQTGRQLLLRATLLSYKPLKKSIEFKNGMVLQIEMESTSQRLKEVVIKAPAIREVGDTIIYRTSAFALRQDQTLSQVLERIPGLEVVGGQIKFEGKAINKFYIEQMDLLGRRYSIASNSLRPEDVATIEIFRDHEPIKMLGKQSLSDRGGTQYKTD